MARVAQLLGLPPHPWQRQLWDVAGELVPDPLTGRPVPAYSRVVCIVPRRAGKTAGVLAWTLQALQRGPDVRAGYMAQTRADAADAWRDEWWPQLRGSPLGRLYTVRESNGSEAIRSAARGSRSRARILSTTSTAGHGKALDLAVVDEAWAHSDDAGRVLEAGVRPAQATRAGAQLWIVSAAGTASSAYLAKWRDVGRAGGPGVAYFEWSADPGADLADPAVWRAAHPALGRTVPERFLADERATMDADEWARAYLGVWPAGDGPASPLAGCWPQLARPLPAPARAQLALDVDVDRRTASVAAAWPVAGGTHVALVEHGPAAGGWLVDAAARLARQLRAGPVGFDAYGPAVDVADELRRRGVPVAGYGSAEYAVACLGLLADALDGRLSHSPAPALDAAAAAAGTRRLGDRWVWDRRAAGPALSPLVAVTLARARALDAPPRAVTRSPDTSNARPDVETRTARASGRL